MPRNFPRTSSLPPVPAHPHRPGLVSAPPERRDDEQIRLALLASSCFRGESHAAIAEGCGTSRPNVTRWTHGHEPNQPSVPQIRRGLRDPKSSAWCRRYLHGLLDHGRHVDLEVCDGIVNARVTGDVLDVVREMARALDDGVIDGPELASVLREADEARDALDGLCARLRMRMREAG